MPEEKILTIEEQQKRLYDLAFAHPAISPAARKMIEHIDDELGSMDTDSIGNLVIRVEVKLIENAIRRIANEIQVLDDIEDAKTAFERGTGTENTTQPANPASQPEIDRDAYKPNSNPSAPVSYSSNKSVHPKWDDSTGNAGTSEIKAGEPDNHIPDNTPPGQEQSNG